MAELSGNPFDQIDDNGSFKGGIDPFGSSPENPWPYSKAKQTSANPFDFVNDDGTIRAGGTFAEDRIGPYPAPVPQSSMLGAFGTHAAMGAVPAVGTLAGGEAGLLAGAAIGSIFPGPGTAIGGIAGGLVGALGGGIGAGMAQDYTLNKVAPEWKDGLDKTMAQQEEQHPYASFVGGLAPYAITMSPTGIAKGAALPATATSWQRLAANPMTSRLFSGAVQGGMELGNEYVSGQSPDWGKVALSTGFGIMFTRPNALGAKISGIGTTAVSPFLNVEKVRRSFGSVPEPATTDPEAPPEPVVPTMAEADAANIIGPGVTEEVFNGSHLRDDATAITASENLQNERNYLGPEPTPQDINEVARSINPDLIDRWNTINSQVDDLRTWIDEQNIPSDETVAALNTRKAELEAQIAATKNKDEQRRLRTVLRTEVQSQIDEAKARSNAYLTGEALPDTPDMTQARLKIVELQNELGRMAPERNALLRLAAERGRTETVPATPIPGPESEGLPVADQTPSGTPEQDRAKATTAALQAAERAVGEQQAANASPLPQRPLAEQRAYIADDVRKQLLAAGRPADEAEAASQLIAARYIARAARMNGVLGSAEDLYRIDGATIQAAKNPEPTPTAPVTTVAAPPPAYDVVRAKAESYGAASPLKLVERLIKSGQTNEDISNVIGRKLSANEVESVRQQIGSPEAKPVEIGGAPALPEGEITRQALAEYLRNGGTVAGAGRELFQNPRVDMSIPGEGGTQRRVREITIGNATISYSMRELGGGEWGVMVDSVYVPPRSRRLGEASRAMAEFLRTADENGLPVYLTAEPVGFRGEATGASKTALEKFYRSLGFVKNTGRNADYRIQAGMVRQPGQTRELFQSVRENTETPEFKRWFGESKVVDEEGKPLVVYHGTNADIEAFDASRRGEATGAPSAKMGFFFASDPAVASSYASTFNAYRDTKIGRFLQKITGGKYEAVNEALMGIIGKSANDKGANVIPTYLSIKNPKVVDFGGAAYRERTYADIIAQAKREGHDGVILRNTVDEGFNEGGDAVTDVYVAFEPTQIKSINNRGTFDPNDARILNQEHRGSISVAPGRKPIIKLFEGADASTFIHESGHQWLEELARDSHHEMATDQLKADWQTVRQWVGAKGDKPITRAQHEKFARGFEQYMRNGIAPSKDLAGVFAQFRNWLVSIYRTVSSLGREISPEIKDVYDRLLTTGERDTLVVPERERQPSMSDIHAADARETPPAKAEPAMARIESEIEDAAVDLNPGVRDEIASIRSTIEPKPEDVAAESPALDLGTEGGAGQVRAGYPEEGGAAPGDFGASQPRGIEHEPVVGGGGGIGREGATVPAEPGRGAGTGEPANGGGSASVRGAASRSPIPAPRPADAIPEPESKFVDKAGNIRLDNIRNLVATDATNGDVNLENLKQVFRDIAKANGEFVNDRRGTVTDSEALSAAYALLGEDPTYFFRKQIGEAFSNSEAIGLQILASQSARNVAELARLAATGGDEDVARYIQAREFHTVLQARYSQATAEAGRALRAFRKINELWSPEATAANSVMQRSMIEGRAKTLYQAKIEAKLLAEMKDPGQAAKFLNDRRTSPGEMILEYWTAGLLSGPTTQTTIAISNTILSLMRALPETALAAGTGRLRQMFGRTEQGVASGEIGSRFRFAAEALPTALKESIRTLRTGGAVQLPGENPKNMPYFNPVTSRTLEEGATMKDVRSEAFGLLQGLRDGFIAGSALMNAGGVKDAPFFAAIRSGEGVIPDIKVGPAMIPIGTAIRLPFRLNAVQDSFFRVMNYSMEKAAEAYRAANAEGLSGDALTRRTTELWNKPTQEMMARASEGSTALTLMGQAGEFTQKLQRLVNHSFNIPGLGETRILKFVNPFVRIASVTLDATLLERTPLGFLKGQVRDDILGKNGAAAQDIATGRMVFGSAVLLTMGSLAAQGYVSGSEPADPSEAAMWRLAGNQAYSIRIGDFWYSVNRLGPLGMLMGMSADLWHVADRADQGDFGGAASSMWHAVSANVLEQSWMTGFSDMLRATTDSGRYGEAYVRNFLASFVPYSVGMGQLARAIDPQTRRAKTVVDAVLAKTPFASQDLMPRRDIWGEAMPSRDALLASGVTAIYTQQVGNDPVNLAMLNLGIHPAPVSPRIRNVELTPQQYDDYARIAGRMAKMRLDQIVRSPAFLSWPAQTRYNVVSESIRQSRETAAGVVMMKYPKIITDAYNLKMGRGLKPIGQ